MSVTPARLNLRRRRVTGSINLGQQDTRLAFATIATPVPVATATPAATSASGAADDDDDVEVVDRISEQDALFSETVFSDL
jgi:hypothetical protein